jgi:hypothetical protein
VSRPLKNCSLDKENRPASMNELKYPSVSKSKHTFYNTEKFESMKIFQPTFEQKIEADYTEGKLTDK